jgi:DNA-binding ferritin-like protein
MPDKLKELNEKEFGDTIKALIVLQSSIHIMCAKVNGYRINIIGGNFYEYHSFLQIVVEKLEKSYYDVGERIRMLGGYAIFSVSEALDYSEIEDAKKLLNKYDDFVAEMHNDFINLSDQARLIFAMSGPVADAGTIALCTGLCFNVFDHFAWETRVMMLKVK